MDITSPLIQVTKNSVEKYAKISKSKSLIVPECWIQCKIADDLHCLTGLNVVVEASRTANGWDSEFDYPLDSNFKGRSGRPDILIFDPTSKSKHVVEIKGPRTTWPSFEADAIRIDQFVRELGFESGTLIYASSLMTLDDLENEITQFKKWCGVVGKLDVCSSGPLAHPSDPSSSARWQILWFTKRANT